MSSDRLITILNNLKFCDEEVDGQTQQVALGQRPAQPDKL